MSRVISVNMLLECEPRIIRKKSGAKDARTPNAGAQFADAWQSRSVWSACVFSAAFASTAKATFALIMIGYVTSVIADTPTGWSTNFDAALKQAETKQQPVLAYFTASWCGPCKLMARTTLTNDSVIETLKDFSYVAVDIDDQHALAEKYGVRAVPSFHVLTTAGDEVTTTTGYQEAGRFVQWLTNGLSEAKEALARQEKFQQTLATVDALLNKTDPESLRNATTQLIDFAGDREESIQKAATDRLTILAKYDPVLLLEGLNHPKLAARIRVVNALKSQLGDKFDVDVWADPATRKKAVGEWREKLAAKK